MLRRGLAYVPQGRIVFPQMTVLENLEIGAYTERDPKRVAAALEQVYHLFPILAERRRQSAGTMSGGEHLRARTGAEPVRGAGPPAARRPRGQAALPGRLRPSDGPWPWPFAPSGALKALGM